MKRISLNNQQCMTQTTLINLHRNECIQGLCYYSFVVNLDGCIWKLHLLYDVYDAYEIVILLIIYLIEYVFQTKQSLNLRAFNTKATNQQADMINLNYKWNDDVLSKVDTLNSNWNQNTLPFPRKRSDIWPLK